MNEENKKLSNRKKPVHLPNLERHNQPTIIYVTVCTKNRRKILVTDIVHNTLKKIWENDTQYMVGKYIIMPDHIHLFCSPLVRDVKNVKQWGAFWKRRGSIDLPYLQPLWQRNCWDRQLRQSESYSEKWQYVCQNPVRQGFVNQSSDWSFQGELNELRW